VEKNLEGRKATNFNFNPFVLFCLCLENTFGWLVFFSAVIMEGVIEIAKSEKAIPKKTDLIESIRDREVGCQCTDQNAKY